MAGRGLVKFRRSQPQIFCRPKARSHFSGALRHMLTAYPAMLVLAVLALLCLVCAPAAVLSELPEPANPLLESISHRVLQSAPVCSFLFEYFFKTNTTRDGDS